MHPFTLIYLMEIVIGCHFNNVAKFEIGSLLKIVRKWITGATFPLQARVSLSFLLYSPLNFFFQISAVCLD